MMNQNEANGTISLYAVVETSIGPKGVHTQSAGSDIKIHLDIPHTHTCTGLIFNNIMAVMRLRLTSRARWLEVEMLLQRGD